jgi:hypothetical protein
MNNYYVNDGYFNNILNTYLKNEGMYNNRDNKDTKDNNDNVKLFHSNTEKCSTCEITNNFNDTSPLGNKKKIYDNLTSQLGHIPSYLPETISFTLYDYVKLYHKFDNRKLWIVKPEYGMRQQGIFIIKSYDELIKGLQKNKKYNEWVMQEYIDKPLLYNGKKFHFRVYALIIRDSDMFNTYLYPKGYMYVADNKYDITKLNNPDIHITSSCNNQEFPNKFDIKYGNGTFGRYIMPQMKNIVRETTLVTYNNLICPNEKVKNNKCYKMIAFDIIADNTQKLYLMEVNARTIGMASEDIQGNCKSSSPSLQTDEFKKELMDNIMDIVLKDKTDTLFINVLKIKKDYISKYIYIITILTLLSGFYIYPSLK